MNCHKCGDFVSPERWGLGRKTCLSCGELAAREERKGWTIVPMPKSNYVLVTDRSLLIGLNSSHKGNK